jgi:hypothetical protein
MKLLLPAAVVVLCSSCLGGVVVTSPRVFEEQKLGLRVIAGELHVPADGRWTVVEPTGESGLEQIYSEIENQEALRGDGARKRELAVEAGVEAGRWRTYNPYGILQSFAQNHGGKGPTSWDDPEFLETLPNYGRPWPANHTRDPRSEQQQREAQQKQFADLGLIPAASINSSGANPGLLSEAATPTPVILELAPSKDDGQHWVVFSDASVKRIPIDAALLARHHFSLSKKNVISPDIAARPTEKVLKLYALMRKPAIKSAVIEFINGRGPQRIAATWDLGAAQPDSSRAILSQWARLREQAWQLQGRQGDSPLLSAWLTLARPLYGAPEFAVFPRGMGANRRTAPTLASLLGGRAAVQETLQLQALGGRSSSKPLLLPGESTVLLASIPGLAAKSHPFAEMLQGKTSTPIPLAAFVPRDRAFLYASKPGSLAGILSPDSAFVARTTAFGPTSGWDYRLLDRYAEDLGVTPAIRDLLLKHSTVTECALFAPDLFFADGTDITLIARAGPASALAKAIKPVIGALSDQQGICTIPTPTGGTAYWAVRDDLWFASSDRGELAAALALQAAKGEGSLGESDEFRYMLHKLPLGEKSRAYVYLSDPFLRRLVGPELKIAQSRRIAARIEMEQLLAGALLRKLDQPGARSTREELTVLGYVASPSVGDDYELKDDYTVQSRSFGSLQRMKPLSAQHLVSVTPSEAAAYKQYLDAYSRFWRQYFDPIAMRLDGDRDDRLSLTTFILPLVDSTIYSAAREWLPVNGRPVRVPVFSQKPVALFSLALRDQAWTRIAGGLAHIVENYIGLSPEFYDLLGPGLHIAITDANPVVRVGGRDLGSAISASFGGTGRDEFLYAPILLNLFTRPTVVAVELTDPDRARQLLDGATGRMASFSETWVSTRFYQIENEPVWILSLRLLGLASTDFNLRIEQGYLLISNQPWTEPNRITATRPLTLAGAALALDPSALNVSLPAQFASETEEERSRAFAQMASLYPWIACLHCTVSEAARQQARLLGFSPALDFKELSWLNGQLHHARLGDPLDPRQPAYRRDTQFGLLDGVEQATLEMQFEDDGLRAIAAWKINASLPATK